jgi:hypothetical protein
LDDIGLDFSKKEDKKETKVSPPKGKDKDNGLFVDEDFGDDFEEDDDYEDDFNKSSTHNNIFEDSKE